MDRVISSGQKGWSQNRVPLRYFLPEALLYESNNFPCFYWASFCSEEIFLPAAFYRPFLATISSISSLFALLTLTSFLFCLWTWIYSFFDFCPIFLRIARQLLPSVSGCFRWIWLCFLMFFEVFFSVWGWVLAKWRLGCFGPSGKVKIWYNWVYLVEKWGFWLTSLLFLLFALVGSLFWPRNRF